MREGLLQQQKGKQHGQHRAGLVDRGNLIHIAGLQRTKIADPARAGGKAGKDQEEPAPGIHRGNAALGADDKNHHPGEDEHHNGAQRGRKVGIDLLDADFG